MRYFFIGDVHGMSEELEQLVGRLAPGPKDVFIFVGDLVDKTNIKEYTDINFIKEEISRSKKLFKKYNWPIIDVTRKSVEESAASILKIFEIQKSR